MIYVYMCKYIIWCGYDGLRVCVCVCVCLFVCVCVCV